MKIEVYEWTGWGSGSVQFSSIILIAVGALIVVALIAFFAIKSSRK